MQIGAFMEKLQWPPQRLAARAMAARDRAAVPLRRMRPTTRGAVHGFPVRQLPRRLAALLGQGEAVTLVNEVSGGVGAVLSRVPASRWVPAPNTSAY